MLSDEDMHARMVNGWRMGLPFTECGNGSTLESTESIRHWIPEIVRRFGIYTICDAGAGDMAWWPYITWHAPILYRPFDLIPRKPEVVKIDITSEELPSCDAILCRMVLNHLDRPRVERALNLFKNSGVYLIATQYHGKDLPQRSIQFQRLDLTEWLGKPLAEVDDGHDSLCKLAIWQL